MSAAWRLDLVTAPALEPLTLDEVKDHLRLTGSAEDPLLDGLIVAARQSVETHLSRALLTQTRKLWLDRWPRAARIELPRPPAQTVTSITYLDADGVEQTLSTSLYAVYGAQATPGQDAEVAYIEPAYGQSWPSVYAVPESIRVTYVCGWLTVGAIPQPIRQAMLLRVAELFEHREEPGNAGPAIMALLANYRVHRDFGDGYR